MTDDQPKVILYSASWCAFCHTEAQWLDHLKIPYVKKDIEEDKEAYEELMTKTKGNYSGVPVTDVAGEVILGFDRPKLLGAIKQAGLDSTASAPAA
jgi:glutaredoxin